MDRVGDAERLRRLYRDRVPRGMSQAEFGQLFGIGTQGMVSQYLTGHTALNVEAMAKFAKGLGCTIADISPEMARQLKVEIFPVLGRISVKAVIALVMLAIPAILPSRAEAAFNISNSLIRPLSEYTLRFRRWFKSRFSYIYPTGIPR